MKDDNLLAKQKLIQYNGRAVPLNITSNNISQFDIDDSVLYEKTIVNVGERPEQLSQRLYNTTDLYWIFHIINPNLGGVWMKSPQEFDLYIVKRFGSKAFFSDVKRRHDIANPYHNDDSTNMIKREDIAASFYFTNAISVSLYFTDLNKAALLTAIKGDEKLRDITYIEKMAMLHKLVLALDDNKYWEDKDIADLDNKLLLYLGELPNTQMLLVDAWPEIVDVGSEYKITDTALVNFLATGPTVGDIVNIAVGAEHGVYDIMLNWFGRNIRAEGVIADIAKVALVSSHLGELIKCADSAFVDHNKDDKFTLPVMNMVEVDGVHKWALDVYTFRKIKASPLSYLKVPESLDLSTIRLYSLTRQRQEDGIDIYEVKDCKASYLGYDIESDGGVFVKDAISANPTNELITQSDNLQLHKSAFVDDNVKFFLIHAPSLEFVELNKPNIDSVVITEREELPSTETKFETWERERDELERVKEYKYTERRYFVIGFYDKGASFSSMQHAILGRGLLKYKLDSIEGTAPDTFTNSVTVESIEHAKNASKQNIRTVDPRHIRLFIDEYFENLNGSSIGK